VTPEDLARLHARAMTVPVPWNAEDFRDLLAHSGTFLIPLSASKYPEGARGATPKAAQDLAGFALGRVVLDEAELLTIAVDPAVQRQGIGRACLAAFEAGAAARGARRLFLEVAETNAPAIALYTSAGWQEAGRRKAYYKGKAARIDAILMAKQLDPE
jgi:ribosomal-protein-alanine N-acetyltransferase